ncbi:Nif3-like dinuclear metal center hexameric protein [Polaribacter vadi]|uniref:Nif3-like dinuclear metal center hexameric protein n=1 Tax=Polaribacter TaxID=52959 RepID=UPI001C09AA5A|nr:MULTISPECIES: Nif3-like dinuclear metal center hexameric protein [Polaribacter]MBU3012980.1 Nif3-like dinuclear metal center hexameric protein [Polaribacter vadi]MDO6742798.1 Nif3-like dinuclear metal center hexameric protein [Polaribacter sp. 1_MG-2023]
MIIKDITNYIENLAPLNYAESFDNVGLLIGNYSTKVTGVLVALDTLEETVDEAIAKNCNLIVSFHPIIFSGLKKLNGNSYVERVVLKAIQNNIAIYATHTALDNSKNGVSAKMCEVLGLTNTKILIPKKGIIKKLTTYVPNKNANDLRTLLFDAGAGNIGNYDNCSFNVSGDGTFRGNENSNPVLGEKGKLHTEPETKISVIFESKNEKSILKALQENHPYEEVAYEIITTENVHQNIGMGMIGELNTEMDEKNFLKYLKSTMKTDCVRHSAFINKKIKKVAVLGGSGSFAISDAKKAGADAYVSADFKYHEFFKAENCILLADIGHYESEQFTKNLLVDYLTKKFSNFAIILSEKSTNPIYYI